MHVPAMHVPASQPVLTLCLHAVLRSCTAQTALRRPMPRITPRRAFKTVVFVIDQLDAFVRGSRQTLLYNMLDALQHSAVQVWCHPGVKPHMPSVESTYTLAAGVPASNAAHMHATPAFALTVVPPSHLTCRMQAVVLGVSCHHDVQHSMEKRVASRFSSRKTFLAGLGATRVCSLPIAVLAT